MARRRPPWARRPRLAACLGGVRPPISGDTATGGGSGGDGRRVLEGVARAGRVGLASLRTRDTVGPGEVWSTQAGRDDVRRTCRGRSARKRCGNLTSHIYQPAWHGVHVGARQRWRTSASIDRAGQQRPPVLQVVAVLVIDRNFGAAIRGDWGQGVLCLSVKVLRCHVQHGVVRCILQPSGFGKPLALKM